MTCMTMQEKLDAARKLIRGPVEASARRMFSSADGRVVLDALSKVFESEMLSRDAAHAVDPHGTLVNVGAAQVVRYLRELAEMKEVDR